MNTGLHPVEAVRFTASNDYACSLCGFRIPTRKTSRNTEELREWQSAVLNDVWSIIGYEGERESEQTLCGDCLRSDCYHLEQARGRV